MKTKKIVAIILAAAMMLTCFAACGKSDKADEAKKLTVALSPDFAPMEFCDTSKTGQDQYVGFDVELAKYIAAEMGLELEIKAMSFDACQSAVQLGSVDMSISGFSKTDERAENYLLSDFYYAGDNETQQTIIVRKEDEGKFSSAEDFDGMIVAAQSASLQMNLCNNQLPDTVEIKEFKAIDDAVMALKTGKVDAVAVAYGNGEAIIANNPEIAMSGFEFEVTSDEENNVILMNKNDTELCDEVNKILAKAYEAGLYGEWYAAAKELAGIDTAAEISYDDDGNVAAE